jgi:hypothetical protein
MTAVALRSKPSGLPRVVLALLLAPLAGTALFTANPALLCSACCVAGICAAAITRLPQRPVTRSRRLTLVSQPAARGLRHPQRPRGDKA